LCAAGNQLSRSPSTGAADAACCGRAYKERETTKKTLETDSKCRPSSLCGNMPRLKRAGPGGDRLDRWLRFVVGNKYESHSLRRSSGAPSSRTGQKFLLLHVDVQWRDLWRIAVIRSLCCIAILVMATATESIQMKPTNLVIGMKSCRVRDRLMERVPANATSIPRATSHRGRSRIK